MTTRTPSPPTWLWPIVMTGLVGLVGLSRWLAFPASIWDIDEAIFARAVLVFDPAHNYPHPPFFPLWIGLGRALAWAWPALSPALGLRLLSAAFGVLAVLPLVALWRLVLPRTQALAAALLYCALPLPWILAGRAYTTTAATTLLLAAGAALLRPEPSRRTVLAGSVALAACILVRPQWLPAAAVIGGVQALRGRGWLRRAAPFAVATLAGVPTVAYFAHTVGGLRELLAVVGRHGVYHFGELARFGTSWKGVALLDAFGSPWLGLLWLLLAVEGAVVLLVDPHTRRTATLLLAAMLAPVLAVLLLLENPDSLRYFLPYLALTSGLVVAALAYLVPQRTARAVILAAVVLGLTVAILPHLAAYRRVPSPAVRALDEIAAVAGGRRIHVIADRNLTSFIELARTEGRLDADVTWDWVRPRGPVISSEPLAVAVFDPAEVPWRVQGSWTFAFHTTDQWLRRFASPRFLDIVVVVGASSAAPSDRRSSITPIPR